MDSRTRESPVYPLGKIISGVKQGAYDLTPVAAQPFDMRADCVFRFLGRCGSRHDCEQQDRSHNSTTCLHTAASIRPGHLISPTNGFIPPPRQTQRFSHLTELRPEFVRKVSSHDKAELDPHSRDGMRCIGVPTRQIRIAEEAAGGRAEEIRCCQCRPARIGSIKDRKRNRVKRSTKWISTGGWGISKIFAEPQSDKKPAGLLNRFEGECVSVEPSKRRRSFAPLCRITGGRSYKFRNRHEQWTDERADGKRAMHETVSLPSAIQMASTGIFVFGGLDGRV